MARTLINGDQAYGISDIVLSGFIRLAIPVFHRQ
jgi:hypothetical protein